MYVISRTLFDLFLICQIEIEGFFLRFLMRSSKLNEKSISNVHSDLFE